jgi:ketosteroid isomerase-like protein
MRFTAALAAAAALAAVSGCGGGGGQSDEDQIKATLHDYYTAFANGDAESACADLASEVQQRLVKASGTEDCPSAIAKARGRRDVRRYTPRFKDAEIVSVKVAGDRAVAKVRAIGVTEPIAMRREGKEWKIDASVGPGGR